MVVYTNDENLINIMTHNINYCRRLYACYYMYVIGDLFLSVSQL